MFHVELAGVTPDGSTWNMSSGHMRSLFHVEHWADPVLGTDNFNGF